MARAVEAGDKFCLFTHNDDADADWDRGGGEGEEIRRWWSQPGKVDEVLGRKATLNGGDT